MHIEQNQTAMASHQSSYQYLSAIVDMERNLNHEIASSRRRPENKVDADKKSTTLQVPIKIKNFTLVASKENSGGNLHHGLDYRNEDI